MTEKRPIIVICVINQGQQHMLVLTSEPPFCYLTGVNVMQTAEPYRQKFALTVFPTYIN